MAIGTISTTTENRVQDSFATASGQMDRIERSRTEIEDLRSHQMWADELESEKVMFVSVSKETDRDKL